MRRLAALFVLIAVLTFAPAAAADTLEVTSAADTGADPGCELREAIETFNDLGVPGGGCPAPTLAPDADEITFAPSLSGQTIVLAFGELPVTAGLNISGPGMDELTIDAISASRVFHTNVIGGGTVEISGLTVTRGQPNTFPDTKGGGILNRDGTELILTDVRVAANRIDHEGPRVDDLVFASGGGIATEGELELNDSVVVDNHVTAENTSGGDGAMARGGGIYADGVTNINQSTIEDNSAVADDTAPDFVEATAGIWSNNSLFIDRSTISHNDSDALSPGLGPVETAYGAILAGGVVSNMALSTVAGNTSGTVNGNEIGGLGDVNASAPFGIHSSTIARNGPESGDQDGTQLTGQALLRSTIVADPLGGGTNCPEEMDSGGLNVDYSPAGPSCFESPSTDLTSDPLLAPASVAAPAGLAANGGPTETIALQPGSPAIDKGFDELAVGDQRGSTRPVDFSGLANADDGSDIGAFEVQLACAGQATPTASCAQPSQPAPPATDPGPTGERAKALKKCKKKKTKKARKKCRKKAKKLPV